MFSVWTVSGVIAVYLIALFVIAFWVDRRKTEHQQHPYIYSLALGVHCTSWAFFGTTTQSAQYGWAFIPTYVGMVLVFLFAFSLLSRIAKYCQTHQISSLADFISARYQSRLGIGALVTFICFIGVIPYIALQLDAITLSLTLISEESAHSTNRVGLYVAGLMALFAILFGTRTLSLTEKHPGLMATIAFESVLKLFGIMVVGLYVCFALFDSPIELIAAAVTHPEASQVIYADRAYWVYATHVLLGICAAFCLPRQFHISFVENNGEGELRTARWMFPLYLLLMTIFILPIALAGNLLLDTQQFSTDSFALAIPISQGNRWIAGIALIGGISAATSMVIVATLALGIMISNNLVTPVWLKLRLSRDSAQRMPTEQILTIRRLTVVVVLSVAYAYHLNISQSAPLVQSGTIAIALLAQLIPAIIVPFFWKRSSALAAWVGILAGGLSWFVLLLWPSITASYYFGEAPTDASLGFGFGISLLLNLLCHAITGALFGRREPSAMQDIERMPLITIRIGDLKSLLERILPPDDFAWLTKMLQDYSENAVASGPLLTRCQQLLAAQVGVSGAKMLLSTIANKDGTSIDELVELAEQASQTLQFNHEILQSSVQHIQQGISVLDKDLTMLAWNERYLELFEYPEGFIQVGTPIEAILRANAHRGLFGDVNDIEAEIEKRIAFMRSGSQYKYVRKQSDQRTIEINGRPLPGGGYVSTYADISDYIRIQEELTEAKQELEARVKKRTEQLENARVAADKANISKTKFLAAAGHDLMQPFNAAILYASMLKQRAEKDIHQGSLGDISEGLMQSLNSAESLLSTLLDMTKLESGVLKVNHTLFSIGDLLQSLYQEFSVIAQQQGVTIHLVTTKAMVRSDKKLLRRILQNLLSNAIRYARPIDNARVVVGVRRTNTDQLDIVIADNGVGIEVAQQQQIFNEFHQINPDSSNQGLGLGLTIVDKMTKLLNHPLKMHSIFGTGTLFAVSVPREDGPIIQDAAAMPANDDTRTTDFLAGKTVLLIENELQIQQAVLALLSDWGADVVLAQSIAEVLSKCPQTPDLAVVDYHLNAGETGIQAIRQAQEIWHAPVAGVLTTANRDDQVKDEAAAIGLDFLPKPVKPLALKRALKMALNHSQS